MRVLLAIHHALEPDRGAEGVTLALGAALEAQGCRVSYFDYRAAWPGGTYDSVWCGVRYPWALAAHLLRAASGFDVLDVTTGDAYLWSRLGRPGASRNQALVTRSHGLEHIVADRARVDARTGASRLSWKYPLYHGGFRLWEVRQSLHAADHVILPSSDDVDYAAARLGVPRSRMSLVPHGLPPALLLAEAPQASGHPELKLAFVGSWIQRKGRDEVVAVARALQARGAPFELLLLGTGFTGDEVRRSFPGELQPRLRIVPRYANAELPRLLAGSELLLFPSHAEGFGMALLEAMACGLAPVAAPVGVAPTLIVDGRNGRLCPVGDARALTAAVLELAADRARLLQVRQSAQRAARGQTWESVAGRTLDVYRRLLEAPLRSTWGARQGARHR